jgi:hypothetical protein
MSNTQTESKIVQYTIFGNRLTFVGNYQFNKFFSSDAKVTNITKDSFLLLSCEGKDVYVAPKNILFSFLQDVIVKVRKENNCSVGYFTMSFINSKNNKIYTLEVQNNFQKEKFFTVYGNVKKTQFKSVKFCDDTSLKGFNDYTQAFMDDYAFLNGDSFNQNLKRIFEIYINKEQLKRSKINEELMYNNQGLCNSLFANASGLFTAYVTPSSIMSMAKEVQGRNAFNVYLYFLTCLYLLKRVKNSNMNMILGEKDVFLYNVRIMIEDIKTEVHILTIYKQVFSFFNDFEMFENSIATRNSNNLDFNVREKLRIGYSLCNYMRMYGEMLNRKNYLDIMNDIIQKKTKELGLLNELLFTISTLFANLETFMQDTIPMRIEDFREFISKSFLEKFSMKNLTRFFMYVFLRDGWDGEFQSEMYKKAQGFQNTFKHQKTKVQKVQVYHKNR